MPTAEPLLNFLGSFPPACLQAGLKLFQRLALHPRRRTAAMRPRQQPRNPTRFERADPIEELPSADGHLLGNLGGGQLTAGGQAQGQQTLLVCDVLTGGQTLSDGRSQIRPV